jgi:hypothetical protein
MFGRLVNSWMRVRALVIEVSGSGAAKRARIGSVLLPESVA